MFLFKPSTDSNQSYCPSKSKYDLVKDASWKEGEKVPFIALAQTFAAIEEVSGRLKSIEIMSNYFSSVMCLSKDDLVKSIYLCLNKVCPDYEGIELGKLAECKALKLTSLFSRYRFLYSDESAVRIDRQKFGSSEEENLRNG